MRGRAAVGEWVSPLILAFWLTLVLCPGVDAGPYVTETSGIRWNDVGGIRWNDVGGIRWNDVGGIRWNDVGGIRWNDVGGEFFTEATGMQWSDVGGIRWNDVGGLVFGPGSGPSIDLELLDLLSTLPDSSTINVIISYRARPTPADLADLVRVGIAGGTLFRVLPMVVVNATKDQIAQISQSPSVRSVYASKTLSFFDHASGELIGLPEVASDPALVHPDGRGLTGLGVTIAVLDTGVDGTHPDLRHGAKVVENVRLVGGVPTGPGFEPPAYFEGVPNTDVALGHGTFVASVAAGSGEASAGLYAGVAPGASILALSAGDVFIVNMLEGFDYILGNAGRFGIRVVNCSWGTQGWFDPADPVNIATRMLYDAGISVVFAAGNYGPAPDTLNPYAVAPWVIGVGSTRKDGRLSAFSSRGIYEELLYHPMVVAPGEAIIAAKAGAVNQVGGVAGIEDPTGGQSVPSKYAANYTISSGTSFAAPHVAGVIALLLDADPSLGPAAIRRILQETATPILIRDRSEVGAGRLDAWAAATEVVDPLRPFGTHVPVWLDERPYVIDHVSAEQGRLTLPAEGSLAIPVRAGDAALSWQLDLAWGSQSQTSDLDIRVLDPSGTEIARSDTLNGLGLFGRVEGVHLFGRVPSMMTVEVSFKEGTGTGPQDFELRYETSVPVLTSYPDVEALEPAERTWVLHAVSRNLIAGRGRGFEPLEALRRGELARSLALAAGAEQRVPASASFADVNPGSPVFPYVETVAGSSARRVFLDARKGSFRPQASVRRLDFAVAMVRAAGRTAEAEARAREPLGFLDESEIPASLKGYVAVALEKGLIGKIPSDEGAWFEPEGKVLRVEACRRLIRLLDVLEPPRPLASAAGAPGATTAPEPVPRFRRRPISAR